jgi:hypothetical protein
MERPPDYVEAARFCNAHGAHATTIDACRIGLSLDPGNAMLHVYRACAYDELGHLPEAAADCEAALRLAPSGASAVPALITLALVRERLGDADGALAAARAAIALEPADREAHAALGTLLAWHGDYAAAWPELECHWLDERIAMRRRFPDLTEWNGEPLAGRRLLLVHGQGLGDLLQMVRYVPRLRERGAEVLLEAPPALAPLLREGAGMAQIVARGTTPRAGFDVFARAMTLGRLCGEDGAPGRWNAPYLRADPARVATWAPRLPAKDGAPRVGLVWAGSPNHPNDRRRSIPLAALAPLAAVDGVRWISLQAGSHAGDPAPADLALARVGGAFADLADAAAVVAQLDLVITVDTAVAHLAGALGVPVWLLLPWRPDWRWSRASRTTTWYPSMRLFHSGEPSWSGVVADVCAELEARSVAVPPAGP